MTHGKSIYITEIGTKAKHTIEKVGQYYGFSYKELVEKSRFSRSKPVSKARNIAMYICHEYIDISFSFIGELFGGRDIRTVLHGCTIIENLLSEEDEIVTKDLKNLIECLDFLKPKM